MSLEAIPNIPEEHAEDLTIVEDGTAKPMGPAIMMEDSAEDAAAIEKRSTEVDQAFGVRPFWWKQIQLAPFAIDREGDWMRHREMLEEAPLKEVIRKPSAMLPDALRVLWFLAHEPEEWLSLPGMKEVDDPACEEKDPEKRAKIWTRMTGKERAIMLEKKIRAWSCEHVLNNESIEAVQVFYDIFNSAQSTRATVKPSERRDEHRAKN